MLQGNVQRHLLMGSGPMLLAYGTVALVGGVDTYFVGRLGSEQLAAFGFLVAVIALVINLLGGFGIGITACVARAVGSGDPISVRRVCVDGAAISLAFIVVLTLVGWLIEPMVFRALGARDAVSALIQEFIKTWLAGLVFVAIVTFGAAALRGVGAMRESSALLIFAALLNVALDPLLMFGSGVTPSFGLRGAAMAFITGNAIAAAATITVIVRRGLLSAPIGTLRQFKESAGNLLAISLPMMLAYSFVPLGLTLTTGIVAPFGGEAVAAFGIASRVQALVLIVPLSVAAAVSPFVGMNFGAERYSRMNEATVHGTRFALVWGVVALIALAVTANPLGQLFSRDETISHLYATGMPILAVSFAPASFLLVVCSALSAAKLAHRSTVLLFLRGIGLSLPLAWVGGMALGFEGVFVGMVVGNWITAGTARFGLARQFWRPGPESEKWKIETLSENT